VAIDATYRAAHERTQEQGFRLDRVIPEEHEIDQSEEERRLEASMMWRWAGTDMWPIPGAWRRLVACQVPLFNQQERQGWGYIDLLGVSPHGLPVVVELKRSPRVRADGSTDSSETPLKMLLQASAYAVSLRKNWNTGCFRKEWVARLEQLGEPAALIQRIPEHLTTVPLVAAAPAAFWLDWLPVTQRGCEDHVEAWQSFGALLAAFEKADLPASFVSISGHSENVGSLGVQPLVRFPLVG
jgi:hypothetical protein